MSPRSLADLVLHDVPLLKDSESIESGVGTVLESELPALPVVDAKDRLVGIFGEREFMQALFPAYIGTLQSAAFVPRSVDAVIEKRSACRVETIGKHANREHIDAGVDFSDVQLAETFLHHRVLIIPIVDKGTVIGVVTRSGFFAALARRFLDAE